MNKFLICFILGSILANSGFSQQIIGTCGTNSQDNLVIKNRMLANREAWGSKLLQRGGAPNYVPVTYWLVSKNDGTGSITIKNVIDNLCALNKIYDPGNIVFYLKAVIPFANTYVYDDPSSTLGEAYINQKMQSNKNAVNIFAANTARASDPGVLAFYTPQGDYVVTNKNYVNSNASTLAHEIGHYFSMPHTFIGWGEASLYNELTMNCIKPTPTMVENGILVEYVDRDKPGTVANKKHCEQAADGFCDTPADYNLGYGFSGPGCSYSGCAKDPDGVKLDPDETNLMGYFLNCQKQFSEQQRAAILKDYLSPGRDYLKKPYTPKPDITDVVNYLSPTVSIPPKGYDTVQFDWADVPNADSYIFEIAENIGFNINGKLFVLNHSDTTLTGLKKSKNYYWRVTPFNQNSFCVVPKTTNFITPSWTVASENIEINGLDSYIYLNAEGDYHLKLTSNSNQELYFHILNAAGAVIQNIPVQINIGASQFQLPKLSSGIYFYRLVDKKLRSNSGKFIIL